VEFEPANRRHAQSYVAVQFIILALLVLVSNRVGFQFRKFGYVGTLCEAFGTLGFLLSANVMRSTLTAIPIPKPDGKLSTSGLYKYVRHPMYSSVLLFCLGLALRSGSLYKYLLTLALAVLFYFKSAYEEKYLLEKYPEYQGYAERVPRFIPFTK